MEPYGWIALAVVSALINLPAALDKKDSLIRFLGRMAVFLCACMAMVWIIG